MKEKVAAKMMREGKILVLIFTKSVNTQISKQRLGKPTAFPKPCLSVSDKTMSIYIYI